MIDKVSKPDNEEKRYVLAEIGYWPSWMDEMFEGKFYCVFKKWGVLQSCVKIMRKTINFTRK